MQSEKSHPRVKAIYAAPVHVKEWASRVTQSMNQASQVMQASKHQSKKSQQHGRHSGRERQPKHRVGLALPAAVVARWTNTTWPDNSGSLRKWHMDQQRQLPVRERLLALVRRVPQLLAGHMMVAVAAVVSSHCSSGCHVHLRRRRHHRRAYCRHRSRRRSSPSVCC
jgi:hypothetical protein